MMNENKAPVFLSWRQSRRPLSDGLSVVLGSSEEPDSPKPQASAGGGRRHEEQASLTQKRGGTEYGTTGKNSENCNASKKNASEFEARNSLEKTMRRQLRRILKK